MNHRMQFTMGMIPVIGLLLALAYPSPIVSAGSISLDLRDAPVEDAVTATTAQRLSMVVNENAVRRARPISLSLRNVSQEQALLAIARKAGIPITVSAASVRIGPEDKSVSTTVPALDTRVYGQSQYLPNSDAAVRVILTNQVKGVPAANGEVSLSLTGFPESGPKGRPGFSTTVFRGRTDADGSVNAAFHVPDLSAGTYSLSVTATALGERDHISQPLTITPSAQVLLTTDKPVYQPGQIIHIRALALAAPDHNPVAGKPAVIEVADSKGNKVFKHKETTSAYGIVSADFQLANEINMGAYKISATVGDAVQEKTVTVDRYVLPRFRVSFKPDRTWYAPGETLSGAVDAQYFFGKPVAGKVVVTISTFDAGFHQIAEVTGALDDTGHFRLSQKLPDFFAGLPLEQGNAFVKAEISVTDSADHEEKASVSIPVAAQAIKVTVAPESPVAVPNVPNRIYVVTTYPDGTPARTRFRLSTEGGFTNQAADGETDDSGVGLVTITPGTDTSSVKVDAHDAQAAAGAGRADLNTDSSQGTILLQTDRALYKVGDTIRLTALTPQGKSAVYFDILRNRQTVLTKTVDPNGGRAEAFIHCGSDLSGVLELHAWRIGRDGNIRRDTRIVYVDPANDLRVTATPDRDTYLPGADAKVNFAVTGPDGKPRPAALGISIVDESVFALQEMQPGMEKVYFLLEKEILEPRFEIHGFSPGDIVRPLPAGLDAERRQKAAGALFAALPRRPESVTMLNSSYNAKIQRIRDRGMDIFVKDAEAVRLALVSYRKAHGDVPPVGGDLLRRLTSELRLSPGHAQDPWKRPYSVTAISASWKDGFSMRSSGPDGKPNTSDDLYLFVPLDRPAGQWLRRFRRMDGDMLLGAQRGGAMVEELAMAAPMAVDALAATDHRVFKSGILADEGKAGAAPARVREYFPETLLFRPSLITDDSGRATLDVPMADSITTWRLTAMASSRTGALGSIAAPMRVFQDFFVDINFPVQLTQGDEVSVPVSVYNYLPQAQNVTLTADKEGWCELLEEPSKTVQLGPNEVKGVNYRIRVTGLGFQKLTIRAQGASRSDAVRREVEIIPNGKRVEQAFNGSLSGTVLQTVRIPEGSVTGASNILVKVYPGVFSTVVEGMDKIFRMPFGCFEQTSSTTYPNVLVLDYTKRTNRITPEIRMKAEQYINLGYQRLLSFEVPGGGFSWFGNAPANKVLTAFGLQEFADMSGVWDVDKTVISRTQAWEASQQNPDGSWTPDANYIDEGLGPMWKSNLLATAYVTWGMAESRRVADGAPGVDAKGASYLVAHQSEATDAYAMAVIANALLAASPNSPATQSVLDRLVKARTDDPNGQTHWKTGQATVTFAGGDCADIETTALAAFACIRSGRYPEIVGRALNWLIAKRDPSGTWGSTQATILTLKALLAGRSAQVTSGSTSVKVLVNGSEAGTVKVTPDNADVMQQVDCRQYVHAGDNSVELRTSGEGRMMYGISAWHYTPWDRERVEKSPLDIKVDYDRTQLAVNETLTAKVRITFTPPMVIPLEGVEKDSRGTGILPPVRFANMVVVDLGVPPGFTVRQEDLQALVDAKTVTRFELTGRQIILYFDRIEANKPVTLSIRMTAQYPLRAQTPQSVVYQYYNPDVRATSAPVGLQVNG